MPETDLVLLFTGELDRLGLKYFVTGSVAGMMHGEPRLTMDVDLVLFLPKSSIPAFMDVFDGARFYCLPREVIMHETGRAQRGHFYLIHHETGFKADVYLAGRDSLHAWAFTCHRQISLGQDSLWIAPSEYVIVRKLEFYDEGRSEKHLRDIAAIMER